MNRRLSELFRLSKTAQIALGALALAACGGGNSEPDAASPVLAAAELSADDRAVAEALLAGFKKESGVSAIGEADAARAACYAQNVDIPAEFAEVHKMYIADYTAIDQDFYVWFEERGVSMEDAWDIAERVKKGFEACAVG